MRHLYLHIPFCSRRCSYCDFAIAVRPVIPGARYVEAVRREWAVARGTRNLDPQPLRTVYLGGGTPSLLPRDDLHRLMAWISDAFGLESDVEVTLEANPDDVTDRAVEAWLTAGVNRVSVGIQSTDDTVLGWMHRTHDAKVARRALGILKEGGVSRVSADVIFGLPEHLPRHVLRTVDDVLAGSPDHVSAYGLTVEEGTAVGKRQRRGESVEARPERYAEEFLAVHDRLTGAGFEHYEVSSYARAGAESRHNRAYWVSVPYLGLGPSAHSFDGEVRWWNCRHWAGYLERVMTGQDPRDQEEKLTADQVALEAIYLGLRTRAGIPHQAGGDVDRAVREGWLIETGGRLVASAEGWLRLDEIAVGLTTSSRGG